MIKILMNMKMAVLSLCIFLCPLTLAAQTTVTTKVIDGVAYQIEARELSYEDAKSVVPNYLAFGNFEFSQKISLAVGYELGYLYSGVNSGASAVSATEVWGGELVLGTLILNGTVTPSNTTQGVGRGLTGRYLLTSIAPPSSSRFGPDRFTAAADVIPGNYSTCDGKKWVGGFRILDGENAGLFIENRHKDECFKGDVTFLPPGVRANSKRQVITYLGENVDWFYHR
jgi:hypothetical protein